MKDGGIAVLNVDDSRVAAMSRLSKGSVVTYGIENAADVRASDIAFAGFGSTFFTLTTPSGSTNVAFPLNGRHNILNALSAAAVGHSFGMTASQIGEGLRTVAPPPQRGEIIHFAGGFTVINDSYNSNPAALLSMVDTLVEGSEGAKRRIVVAGEMLELGDDAERIHAEIGVKIAAKNVDMLIGVRGLGQQLVEGAMSAGLSDARFAADTVTAGEMLADEIREGDVVLVKGSRGVRTEKVIEKLLEKFEAEKSAAVQR
jgi:UDP-N-acetylmuramoyl-tripeptide--D-alanyl-D-alanine ligase